MVEIGWGKLILIGVVALLVIGPKELPAVLRMVGQWMTKLRRMAAEFQSQFQEAMREAELAELKKQVDEVSGKAQSYANIDPLSDVRREFETTQRQIESAVSASPAPRSESGETDTVSAGVSDTAGETKSASARTAAEPVGGGTEPGHGDGEGKPA
jgi:sec-independent protein translocase protein TatB